MGEVMNLAHPNNPCNGRYGKCLDVKITNQCNGSCAFCIEREGYSPEPAPVQDLITATMSLPDYQTVLILGGEPFQYMHLVEYLKGIQAKKEIFITTNGSLLGKDIATVVAPYITAINISIHHYDEKRNADIYGMHIPYAPIEEAIAVFRDYGVRVRINTNLVKGLFTDYDDLFEMNRFAAGLGAHEIRFAELQYCADGYVPASQYIPGLPDDPFKHGCETVVASSPDFKTIVRQTCGLVNPCRKAPENPICCGPQTKVLYPNGEISNGWKSKGWKKVETVGEILQEVWPRTCHTWVRSGGHPSCHDLLHDSDLRRLATAQANAEGAEHAAISCHTNC